MNANKDTKRFEFDVPAPKHLTTEQGARVSVPTDAYRENFARIKWHDDDATNEYNPTTDGLYEGDVL